LLMFKNLLENARYVFLEVTNHCNFRCSFCPQAISTRPPEHMDTTLATTLIKQLYNVGYKGNLYFHLLGEPFLHPEIFKIVEYASRRMPRSILFTNGSLLTTRNIESVFDASPYELMISMQLVDEGSFKLKGSSMSWDRYASGIRKAIEYKLTHDTPTLLRISVGMRKEDAVYPDDDYFPRISPETFRENILRLFSGIQCLDLQQIQNILADIPFRSSLEIASGVFVSVKPMGNWLRLYREEITKRGYCPHVGKEFGVLSNGNLVLCHLDYDGKTAFANARESKLRNIFQNSAICQTIEKFCAEGIVPKNCQHCVVPHKYSTRFVQ